MSVTRSAPTQVQGYTSAYSQTPKYIGNSWKQVSQGLYHAIAIKSDGTLWGWGYNNNWQVGNGSSINRSSPVQIATGSWSSVSARNYQSFALRSDGLLFGWGINNLGQLGLNDLTTRSSPTQIGTSSWTSVSAGTSYTLAIRSDSTLWAWGDNSLGELGLKNYFSFSSPVQVAGSWVQASAGGINPTSLAIDTSNKLFSWGDSSQGGLGNNQVSANQPALSWTQIAGNAEHTIAIRQDGLLFGWGLNTTGELGDGTTQSRSSPVQIGTSSWTFVSVNGGAQTNSAVVSAIRADGTLWSWGDNSQGQLGDGTTVNKSSPVQVSGGGSWSSVSAGKSHRLAIKTNGSLYAWGNNAVGQFGDGTVIFRSSPTQIPGSDSWTSVSVGEIFSVGIKQNGTLWTWGRNLEGQLGTLSAVNRSSPIQIGTGSWTSVFATSSWVHAIDTNNKLFAWGGNGVGQLGTNDVVFRSSPVQISGGNWSKIAGQGFSTTLNVFGIQTDGSLWAWGTKSMKLGTESGNASYTYSWSQISAGPSHTAAVRSDGRLYAFGLNTSGQLGDGTVISRSSPVQISAGALGGTGEFWRNVSVNGSRTVAIRSDGALFNWGDNTGFKLGISDTIYRSSPVQVGTSSWTTVSAGLSHTLAIRNDGGLFSWGDNTYKQIGDNSTLTLRSSPTQIGTSSWTQVSAGGTHSFGIDINNKLYGWGDNTSSQLGTGSPYYWSSIAIGGSYGVLTDTSMFAIRSDGKLFAWGNNASGQLGFNDLVTRSSPTQLGTNNWIGITAGLAYTLGITSDGKLWSWGSSPDGSMGDGTTAPRSSPVQVGTDNWSVVTTTNLHVLALKSDRTLWAWGNNSSWQLATGDFVNRSSPIPIGTGSWSQIATGGDNSYAIDINGKLWAWGANAQGQIGDGTVLSRSSPSLVNAFASWSSIGAGAFRSVAAIQIDGSLWAWGYNNLGGLGTGDTVSRSSPVQISAGTVWNSVYCGGIATGQNMYAISKAGNLYVTGTNTTGQLGDGTTVNKSTLTLVGALSWNLIVAHSGSAMGTSGSNNTYPNLFVWGANNTWQIGDNTTVNKSSPVQITAGILNLQQYVSSPVQLGTSSWTQISAGLSHTIGIKSDYTLWAWGDNTYGQLGFTTPTTVLAGSNKENNATAYVRTGDNTLTQWGPNDVGQLGDNSIILRSSPVQISSGLDIRYKAIAKTKANTLGFTLALDTTNTLYAWGNNANGQLGINSTTNRSSPTQVSTSSWTQMSAGINHTLAIKVDGTLWGWGLNTAGQIGVLSWRKIAAGPSHTMALRSDNILLTMGLNGSGQLGDGTTISKNSPVAVSGGWRDIAIGGNHSLALREDSTLWTWGLNTAGQLGTGVVIPRSAPIQLGVSQWLAISTGDTHSLGITLPGQLYAWGNNINGQLGIGAGDTVYRSSPTQVTTGSWSNVAGGISFSTAIDSIGRLWSWGRNNQGQLGLGDTLDRSSPVQISSSKSWSQVATGGSSVMALATDSTMWSWGDNTTHQLLQPASIMQVGLTGTTSYMVLRSDNTLWGWGFNNFGQLGDSTTTVRGSPIQAGVGTSWNFIASHIGTNAANQHLAISTTGKLYAWGANNVGQLGLGDIANRSSPVQVTTAGNDSWTFVTTGGGATGLVTSIGITTQGKLFTWGTDGINGLLGQSTRTIDQSAPIQVGTGTSWTSAAMGSDAAYAIKSDGSLWTWGLNSVGQLALGLPAATSVARSSPIQIGTSSWTQVAAGNQYVIMRDINGIIYSAGINSSGTLGLGDTINRSSPVQIGTSSWTFVSANYTTVMGITTANGIFSWGTNANANLGTNDTITRSAPTQIAGTGPSYSFTFVSANPTNGFGIDNNKKLWMWGTATALATSGTLWATFGTTVSRSSPVQMPASTYPSFSSPTQVGTSSWNSVGLGIGYGSAVKADGTLWAWGVNNAGQMGQLSISIEPIDYKVSPVQVTGSWRSVYAGGSSVMAVNPINYTLYGWGLNSQGNLGTTDNNNRSSPVQVATTATLYPNRSSPVQIGSDSWISVTAGESYSVGVKTDGTLWAWGLSATGGLGDGTVIGRSSPVQIGSASNWSLVNSGGSHTVALTTLSTAYAWGYNANGQLGINTIANRSAPVQVTTTLATSWTTLSAGNSHTVGLDITGMPYAWGLNTSGQLGTRDLVARSNPTQVYTTDTGTSWNSIQAGALHSAGSVTNYIYTWGNNAFGQLALGDVISRSSPIQISALWYNDTTQLKAVSSPIQVGTTSWISVAAGSSHSAALSTDLSNALWTWGNNSLGQLGDNTVVSKSSPTQITNASSFTALGTGYNSLFATTNTSLLFGTGLNASGLLGILNDAANRSTPTQVLTSTMTSPIIPIKLYDVRTSSFTQVQVGPAVTVLSSTGTVWAWGTNASGQLGNDTIISRSSPVQVGLITRTYLNSPTQLGTSSWTVVSSGEQHQLAIRSDGALFGWGYQGTAGVAGYRSSPVQIGANSWVNAAAGYRASVGIDSTSTVYVWGTNTNYNLGTATTIPGTQTLSPVSIGTMASPISVGYNNGGFIKNS
jgi:alpha-tubulin suppressor-like RCC1 family protein